MGIELLDDITSSTREYECWQYWQCPHCGRNGKLWYWKHESLDDVLVKFCRAHHAESPLCPYFERLILAVQTRKLVVPNRPVETAKYRRADGSIGYWSL